MNGNKETEERQESGKIRHLRFSRKDTIVNDLKNSTAEGILSFVLSLISLGIVAAGVYMSFKAAGDADMTVGILMIAALLIAVSGIFLGVTGLKNRRKIRHYMERRGIILNALICILLTVFYIRGFNIYF